MKTSLLVLAALGLVRSADWDYKNNGEDWCQVDKACCDNVPNQSPINLSTEGNGEFDKYMRIPVDRHRFQKDYKNYKDAEIHFNGHTSQVNLPTDQPESGHVQMVDHDGYTGPTDFKALQFHFHAGSEHTLDGVRFDLEMHTVHQSRQGPADGIEYAALGFIFDTKRATANIGPKEQEIIDTFFDSLQWDKMEGKPVIPMLTYGKLVNMINTDRRYIYRGSVTTPPCARFVNWNLVADVYPIQQKHVDMFKQQLMRNTKQAPPLVETGNWRKIMPSEPARERIRFVQDWQGRGGDRDMGKREGRREGGGDRRGGGSDMGPADISVRMEDGTARVYIGGAAALAASVAGAASVMMNLF